MTGNNLNTKTAEILLVEDAANWQDILKTVLEQDHNVDIASSYGEAIGNLKRNSYCLVILDLRLRSTDPQNLDGIRVLEVTSQQKIPSIVVTGYGSREVADRAFELGIIGFVDKEHWNSNRFRELVHRVAGLKKPNNKVILRWVTNRVIGVLDELVAGLILAAVGYIVTQFPSPATYWGGIIVAIAVIVGYILWQQHTR